MAVHVVLLILLRHLSANQSKIPFVLVLLARFPDPTSGWASCNGALSRSIWYIWDSPRAPHLCTTHVPRHNQAVPGQLLVWLWSSNPLHIPWISLLCCIQPGFSTLIGVKFCQLWDFNHSLWCQLFSKGANINAFTKERMKENTQLLILLIYINVNNFKEFC